MIVLVSTFIYAMLLSCDVWGVYGVVVPTGALCSGCVPVLSEPESKDGSPAANTSSTQASLLLSQNPSVAAITSLFAESTNSSRAITMTSSLLPTVVTTSTSPVPTANLGQGLRPEARIGIAVTLGVLGIALMLVAFEAFYLRRRRTQRALERAVEEVERGTNKASEERTVLESRVSIVLEEEPQEEDEIVRNGMSLPRRQ